MPSDENCSKRPGMPGVHIKRHGQGLPWPMTQPSPSLPSWVILIAVAALVFGQEAAQGKFVTEIQGVVGKESAQAIQAMIEKTRVPALGLFAAVMGLMTLLFEATGAVMVAQLGRPLVEVPVGFKWLADGLSDGSLDFDGEESVGASSSAWMARSGPRTRTGSSWVSWPRGSPKAGRDLGALYAELTREFGAPVYKRIDAPATTEQKQVLSCLSPVQLRADQLASDTIWATLTAGPGNGKPIL